jgi:hypothetical protein
VSASSACATASCSSVAAASGESTTVVVALSGGGASRARKASARRDATLAERAVEQAWKRLQLGRRGQVAPRLDQRRRRRRRGARVDACHLPDGVDERLGVEAIAAREPRLVAAAEAHGEPFFAPQPHARGLAGGGKLHDLDALEESVDQIVGPLGELRQRPGEGGAVELAERHGRDCRMRG